MTTDAVTAEEFDRIAELHCRRWSEQSIQIVRSLLVEEKRISVVAEEFRVKPQQANVLRSRFLERMRREAVIKLPAEEYMQRVTPANSTVFDPFKKDIKQLIKRGYTESQIADFLRANDVKVKVRELSKFIEAMNENLSSGEPKGRRR